jgi:hypothetical protein
MASRNHQIILGLIARKIRLKGYDIVSFDGNETLISDLLLRSPFPIKKHRPDLISVNILENKICIGEAKTSSDLNSVRTKRQFSDFASINESNSLIKCELIIGIPQSAEKKLKKLLTSLDLINKPNVTYIWIPDSLLSKNSEFNI